MIYDTVENMGVYRDIPALTKCIAYFETHDVAQFEIGRYPVDGEDTYLLIDDNPTADASEKKLETHKTYIDFFITLGGEEKVGYAKRSDCVEPKDALPEVDAYFFDAPEQYFEMKKGMFLIVFPGEGHRTKVRNGDVPTVRRAVFKILV